MFDETQLALPSKSGHTVLKAHLVKPGPASPCRIQIKRWGSGGGGCVSLNAALLVSDAWQHCASSRFSEHDATRGVNCRLDLCQDAHAGALLLLPWGGGG